MGSFRIDWRWVALLVFLAVLSSSRSLPWPMVSLALGAGGGYLLYLAWQRWAGMSGGSRPGVRVTYWRGQRIETHSVDRRAGRPTDLGSLAPIVLYAIIGLALMLGALQVLLNRI